VSGGEEATGRRRGKGQTMGVAWAETRPARRRGLRGRRAQLGRRRAWLELMLALTMDLASTRASAHGGTGKLARRSVGARRCSM
jgi:hypothetical protein